MAWQYGNYGRWPAKLSDKLLVVEWSAACLEHLCSHCILSSQGLNIHAGFADLLRELNRQDAPYALSVANRLYGEQSFQFLKVCV